MTEDGHGSTTRDERASSIMWWQAVSEKFILTWVQPEVSTVFSLTCFGDQVVWQSDSFICGVWYPSRTSLFWKCRKSYWFSFCFFPGDPPGLLALTQGKPVFFRLT